MLRVPRLVYRITRSIITRIQLVNRNIYSAAIAMGRLTAVPLFAWFALHILFSCADASVSYGVFGGFVTPALPRH